MIKRKTITKLFLVWQFEKEEQWLNLMAQSGWLLDGVGFCKYHFISCEPGEYTIRLEMHSRDEAYISFMEETGAEYIGRMVQWIFFRKKAEYGPFDIFSDIDSKISHLNKIGKFLSVLGGANVAAGLVNAFNPTTNTSYINLLCATLLMYALGRIHGKKESLEKDRLLQE